MVHTEWITPNQSRKMIESQSDALTAIQRFLFVVRQVSSFEDPLYWDITIKQNAVIFEYSQKDYSNNGLDKQSMKTQKIVRKTIKVLRSRRYIHALSMRIDYPVLTESHPVFTFSITISRF